MPYYLSLNVYHIHAPFINASYGFDIFDLSSFGMIFLFTREKKKTSLKDHCWYPESWGVFQRWNTGFPAFQKMTQNENERLEPQNGSVQFLVCQEDNWGTKHPSKMDNLPYHLEISKLLSFRLCSWQLVDLTNSSRGAAEVMEARVLGGWSLFFVARGMMNAMLCKRSNKFLPLVAGLLL